MNFCTTCGNRLEAGLKFCTQCGAPAQTAPEAAGIHVVPESIDATTPSEIPTTPPAGEGVPPTANATVATPVPEWEPSPVVPLQPAPAATKSSCMPALLITLAVLALIAVIAVGGVVYVGYKIKQKATAVLHQAEAAVPARRQADAAPPAPGQGDGKLGAPGASTPDGAAGLLEGFSNLINGTVDQGDPVKSVSERDSVDPCAPASYPAQAGARVPLEEGTVITIAWGVVYEDVESALSVQSVTPSSIELMSNTGKFKQDDGSEQEVSSHRTTICKDDLHSGGEYITQNGTHVPPLVHGATRLRLSDRSFAEIKATGRISMDYMSFQPFDDAEKPYHDVGVLTRVEPDDVPYPVIVNDERITLPAIHLTGVTDSPGPDPRPKKDRPNHSQSEIYVIDDPLDPLVLLWRVKDPVYHDGKFRIEVVKIDFKVAHPVNTVEKQLTEQKRAVTYGIYFDFNKDTIKPESEKVLKEIVQAMTDNPDWKLTVEGHTDNIGGDAYNLDLSKRRAAAVKQALVDRYHIAPERLSTNGFGASRPIETNDTLEGRARNRRVELSRE